jgi:hypothetical protein
MDCRKGQRIQRCTMTDGHVTLNITWEQNYGTSPARIVTMSDRDNPPPALGARKSPGFGPYRMRSPLSPDTLKFKQLQLLLLAAA